MNFVTLGPKTHNALHAQTNEKNQASWLGKHKVELLGVGATIVLATVAIATGILTGGVTAIICGAVFGGLALTSCGATSAAGIMKHRNEEKRIVKEIELNSLRKAGQVEGEMLGHVAGAFVWMPVFTLIGIGIMKVCLTGKLLG